MSAILLTRASSTGDDVTSSNQPCPRDQDHVVLDDDTIISIHGSVHPPDHIVGEVVYVPDRTGSHRLFARQYCKSYQRNGQGIPEEERYRIRDRTGSFFDDTLLFRGKSIIHRSRVRKYVPCTDLATGNIHPPGKSKIVRRLWWSVRRLLGDPSDDFQVALTGSLNLDPDPRYAQSPNDVDLVFTGSTASIANLVKKMSTTIRAHPGIRVYEYGKGWRIRIKTEDGLLCSFFRYGDVDEAPLRELKSVRTVRENVDVYGLIVDDTHNVYMPTILEVKVQKMNSPDLMAAQSRLPVIIYHLRSRGDFFQGDRGHFKGALLEITDRSSSYLALSVPDGTSSMLLTPPWTPY